MELKTSNDSSDRTLANYMIAPFLNTNKLVDEAIKTQMIRNKMADGNSMRALVEKIELLVCCMVFIS